MWDLKAYQGKKAIVKVIDLDVYPWGHILADQFVLTDNKNENLYSLSSAATLLADFEGVNWGDWQVIDSSEEESNFWRMRRIQRLCTDLGIRNVSRTCMTLCYWDVNSGMLKKNSELFSDAFYSSTLPAEVVEAVAANLTILKSPTVLRQWDGRFWAWEGCKILLVPATEAVRMYGTMHRPCLICSHLWRELCARQNSTLHRIPKAIRTSESIFLFLHLRITSMLRPTGSWGHHEGIS